MKFNEILKKVKKLGNLYDLKLKKLFNNVSMKRLFIILGIFMFISIGKASATTSVGIISDTLMTQTTPYNYYYKTPDFIIQDL
ncbi:MAG: hypothetical protein IKJ86_08825, partial [Clostridia bacterium]|nr:hypothetical protein [Clostridia bacterium]